MTKSGSTEQPTQEVDIKSLPIEDQVKYYYSHGNKSGLAPSIQDIARYFRLEVEEVLTILEMDDLKSVETSGDLIDTSEAGPGAYLNPGTLHDVKYSKN